ncbi:MAG: toll/interleukin-1 receptor domain-containing protein [Chthoniobacterales bacterium]|nr:toll/interleukin-1 receptor domain-containing protein [Chthoniobacterales bacterium]
MNEPENTSAAPADFRNPRVFISYCTEDKNVAEAVCAGLESSGIPCWIAPRDVRPGQNWGGSIVKSIAAAKVMVLVFSRHTNNSRHVMNEIERAVSHRVTIIPFRIEKVQPSEDLELFISSCHWLDAFSPPRQSRITDLVNAVGEALGQQARPPEGLAHAAAGAASASSVRSRRGVVLGLAAVAAFVLAAAIAFFFLRPQHEAKPPAETTAATPAASPVATAAPTAAAPPVQTEDLAARADACEEDEDFVGALEAYGAMLARNPSQPPIRMRAANAIARLMEDSRDRAGDQRLVAAVRAVADANVAAAQNFLGILLRKTNPQESLSMFKKAAEQGMARAMAEAGLMISNGDGAPADMVEAAKWLKRSADAGFPEGMMLYAECLLTGKGTPMDERQAAELYSKAAALGNVAAKSHLARLYQHGVGVPAADPKKAFQLFEEASAQGFVEAQGRLGAMYMSGEAGSKDPQKAVQLWEDGAGKGDTVCMLFFAISLESGAIGPPNKTEATFWYQKAAKAGNPDAQNWCIQNRVDF